ncbi:TonB-dependent receptor [Altericroceibacterium xinjiangense]|uniref:TonB-dependent receptor n=1 Tax=Altericroceibacterium xinjiangense TaxID=762261 RepID=UPI000F7E4F60|nr:TonB-dependent receptor [Altericroceibacterium xinjiangense]
MTRPVVSSSLKSVLLAGGAFLLPAAAMGQDIAVPPPPLPESADVLEEQISEEVPVSEIVVTGFQASLNAAVAAKRASASQVDVIVAEDIAKFPDTNLAESLQRVPGVAIQRDAGEGRQIVVRGLGSQFTRVRVNGMEAIAASPDNAGRGFDFNIFASELFSSIIVHKTAEASLDEGSLGAVVDLNTGNPLSYDPGFSLVGSAQVRYNDLNENVGPRLAGLVGWTNEDQTLGVSVSAAYSKYETSQLGNNTVRWQQAAFRSVEGTDCFANRTYVSSPVCDEVGLAFHPRIPRYGLISHDRERLGLTGSIQWAPSDRTNISIDGLYANFSEDRQEFWGEVLFRSNERTIDVVDYTIDENNNLIKGTFDNAWVRTENYLRQTETDFYQVSGRLEHQLTDRLAVNLLAGKSRSNADSPVETTLIFDDRDFKGYSHDYTDMYRPVLTFGGDGISDPAQFQLAEFRDRPGSVVNEFQTLSGNVVWEVTDEAFLEVGALYRKFGFDQESFRRDSTYCGAFSCAPGQYGLPVTADISELFTLGSAGQPAGTTTTWLIPQLQAAADAVNLYEREARRDLGSSPAVTEEVTGGYFQVDWDTEVLGFRTTGNFGTRYVNTDQSSTGFIGAQEVTVERSYDDWLPAINLNVFLSDDLILRGAVSKVITRPSLGTLSPGGSIDEFNFRLSSGNPFLDPYRAVAYDASLEWYVAPGALASVAVFAKDIASFPIASSLTGTFASFASYGFTTDQLTPGTPVYNALVGGGNPNVPFEFRTQVNGEGASLKGIELSLVLPFSAFAEGFFADFGIIANGTLIDSDVDYTILGPATALNSSGNPTGGTTDIYVRPLIDLAKKAANGTIYYENERFSARVSAAWRDGYIDGTSGNRNIFEGFGSTLNVDASIRYRLTEQIEFAVEGTNLTDQYRTRWVNDPSMRNYEYNHFGRVIMAGVRFQL